ncbi:MAG: hypothetical protein WEF51_01015 [Chloroflexota bacterium]
MPNRHLPLLVVALLAIAACSPAAAPPSGSPGPTGSGSPSPGSIEHPTGATDVVLRYEDGGGMMVDINATQVPIFTLYGDGTILFRNPMDQPPADENFLLRYLPLKTAKLSEDQIQEVLAFAIGPGGLGTARGDYPNPTLADGTTATFTLRAGGGEKIVGIYGLIETGAEGPDARERQAFMALAERLRNFDDGGTYPTVAYEPPAYRAYLMETSGVIAPLRAWPWPNLKPSDFAEPEDPNAPFRLPQRVLTPAEVEAIGLGDVRGGALGIYLTGPDGKQYSLSLRPLLPGEAA